MKYRIHLTLALGLAHALLAPAHAQTDAGLQAINDLAQVNGQALACQELKVAGRIKSMMLAHAPKTARFGSAFEEGTQQSYLAQTRSNTACPDAAKFTAQLDTLAQRLQTSLPIQAAEAAPGTPSQKP